MDKKELIEIIRQEIDSAVVDTLKQKMSAPQSSPEKKTFKPRGLSEEEIDSIIFHGGRNPKEDRYTPITIKESDNKMPKIMKSEVDEFEKKFKDKITNAAIVFDKQKNGYSLMLSKVSDGVEALASGIINVGASGKIIWSFSILSGIKISTVNFKLGQENKTLFQDLYDFYTSWEKDWRDKLTDSGEAKVETPNIEPNTSPQSPTV